MGAAASLDAHSNMASRWRRRSSLLLDLRKRLREHTRGRFVLAASAVHSVAGLTDPRHGIHGERLGDDLAVVDDDPVRERPARVSWRRAYTASPRKCGPSTFHFLRDLSERRISMRLRSVSASFSACRAADSLR